jgi:hypothetical protein
MTYHPDQEASISPARKRRLLNIRLNAISSICPGLHSSLKGLGVGETFVSIFFCPTGRRAFLRSGAVENDLLFFG